MNKFPDDKKLKEMREFLEKAPASKLLPKNASPVEKTKFSLCEKFVIYKNKNSLTQRALAEKVGIDEALMSKILHYSFEEFTTDRLIRYLSKIYPNITIEVLVA